MSILKDLDPQYAKLHTQQTPGRLATRIGAATLALGGAFWVATHTTSGSEPHTQAGTAPSGSSSPIANATIGQQAEAPPAVLPPQQESTTQPGATIRDDRQHTTDEQTSPFAAITENTRESTPPKKGEAGVREIQAGKASPAKTGGSNSMIRTPPSDTPKRINHASNGVAKNEKNQAPGAKKAGERDIDIITAIVR